MPDQDEVPIGATIRWNFPRGQCLIGTVTNLGSTLGMSGMIIVTEDHFDDSYNRVGIVYSFGDNFDVIELPQVLADQIRELT